MASKAGKGRGARASAPTSTQIAERIDAHLKAAEADDGWNARDEVYGGKKLFSAHAWRGGRWILVTYISYQGRTSLSKDEAVAYLAWLDAGNRGRHFEQQKETEAS